MTQSSTTPAAAGQTQKRVLNVGCGSDKAHPIHKMFRNEQWKEIRLDIDPKVKPDIVASITDMSVVESASVDAVHSSHNLEHLFWHEVPVALKEFHRVLKPGGFVFLAMPDVEAVAAAIVDGKLEEQLYKAPAGPITALDILYGFRRAIANGHHFMAHKTGFTAATLKAKLEKAGFKRVKVDRDVKNYALSAGGWKE
jgi:ubiquinone/menaquinone biosynthesis C-methylase UbiE